MDSTAWKYVVICSAVLAFTGWNRRVSMRAFQFAGLLAAICLTTNILNHTLYFPQALAPYPVIDAVGGTLASLCFWRRPRFWSLGLSTSFLVMGAIHTLFWYGQATGDGYEKVFPYMNNLGVVFNIQLALLCVPGGIFRACQFFAWCADRKLLVLRPHVRPRSVRDQGEKG